MPCFSLWWHSAYSQLNLQYVLVYTRVSEILRQHFYLYLPTILRAYFYSSYLPCIYLTQCLDVFYYTCFWIKVNVKCNWKFKIWNWKCFAPVILLIDRNIHANLNLVQGLYLVTFLRGRALVLIILFVNGCWMENLVFLRMIFMLFITDFQV